MANWSDVGAFHPIQKESLDAALRLRSEHMTEWAVSSTALYSMRDALPGNGDAAVLGRVAAVNSLYNAGLGSAVMPMTRRIQLLTAEGSLQQKSDAPADVVERIAFLPGRKSDAPGCQVFASKYAHFFVDPSKYPIYDQHAARALMRHDGVLTPGVLDGRERYRRFCEVLASVVSRSPGVESAGYGDLDAYLWLAGIFREWSRRRLGLRWRAINANSSRFFDLHLGSGNEVDDLLGVLVDADWFFEDIPAS